MEKKEKSQYPSLSDVKIIKDDELKQIKGGCWTCTTCNSSSSVSHLRPNEMPKGE